jgi:serine/threonine protein kinase/formylglycine-generating enzyme required for sulfatase activity
VKEEEQDLSRWSHLERLFHETCELPPPERREYLEREEPDASLRDEVLELLSEHDPDFPEHRSFDDDLTGSRFGGFEIVRCIGRGAMGDVYEAVEESMDRRVAVKVLRRRDSPSLSASREHLLEARFREEIEVLGRLDHAGIVPIHSTGRDEKGRRFFAMRLVTGEDFQTIIDHVHAGDPEWSMERALGVLLRVCETMVFAHHRGILHRDLKPSHILVGPFGEVYIVDWGLAKILHGTEPEQEGLEEERSRASHLTLHGDVLGTPAYMPPEQAAGRVEAVDERSDVYSLGAVLYHLLSGAAPFSGADEMRPASSVVLERLRGGPPPPVVSLHGQSPAELAAICEKAMARDPAGRYPSAKELSADLSAFLENRVVTAYRTGPFVELRKWVVRDRLAAFLLVMCVALALVSSIGTAVVLAARNRSLNAEREQRLEWVTVTKLARDLLEEAAVLEPIPANLSEFERWLDRSREILAVREGFARDLRGWAERRGEEPDEVRREEIRLRIERNQADVEMIRSAMESGNDRFEQIFEAERRDFLEWDREQILEDIEEHTPILGERLVGAPHLFTTTDDEVGYEQLSELDEALASLERKRELMERRAERTRSAEELERAECYRKRWDEAIASISASAVYGGLKLEVIPGLLPLGVNAESGRWEFWHLSSGDEPERDPESGRFRIEEETGIVLVLLPAGSFLMGAQALDPEGPGYDPEAGSVEYPVHEVTLDAFLISKYEVSQAQWLRMTGTEPSHHPRAKYAHLIPKDLRNPVENIPRGEARKILHTFRLTHPTEAQWEYAARAGTTTPWWTGSDLESLQGRENFGDLSRKRLPNSYYPGVHWTSHDDGHPFHAPVDSFEPNPWGLYNALGNVGEWVLETYADYAWSVAMGRGERLDRETREHLSRGGHFKDGPRDARVSRRTRQFESRGLDTIGLRPVRSIEPFPDTRGGGKRYR